MIDSTGAGEWDGLEIKYELAFGAAHCRVDAMSAHCPVPDTVEEFLRCAYGTAHDN